MSALDRNIPSEALRRLETIMFDANLVQLKAYNVSYHWQIEGRTVENVWNKLPVAQIGVGKNRNF